MPGLWDSRGNDDRFFKQQFVRHFRIGFEFLQALSLRATALRADGKKKLEGKTQPRTVHFVVAGLQVEAQPRGLIFSIAEFALE